MSDLLIRATPALLDGWCGPVVIDDGKTPAIHLGIQHPREGWVALGEISNHGLRRPVIEPVQQPVAAVQLDLARAECRDRVARVLARHVSHQHGAPFIAFTSKRPPYARGTSRNYNRFTLGTGVAWSSSPREEIYHLATLATLDPSDDTRLPDGSRRVDALALAMVWREVCDGV